MTPTPSSSRFARSDAGVLTDRGRKSPAEVTTEIPSGRPAETRADSSERCKAPVGPCCCQFHYNEYIRLRSELAEANKVYIGFLVTEVAKCAKCDSFAIHFQNGAVSFVGIHTCPPGVISYRVLARSKEKELK